tara:strand:+ start:435 stop:563 length:129 start_codon:yes stop_codon:yes gene_type:complete
MVFWIGLSGNSIENEFARVIVAADVAAMTVLRSFNLMFDSKL